MNADRRFVLLVIAVLLAGILPTLAGDQDAPTTQGAQTPTTRPAAAPPDARITPEGWFAHPKTLVAKPKLPKTIVKAFVIPIREQIGGKTFEAIQRKALRCRASGAELIIFDMDTWGGAVSPALDIARLLKTELDDIYTVCYVRTRGISAGALIALACDEIVMTPTGKLGDAAPITLGAKLEGIEREKAETVLRKEFAESAQRNGYPVALAESMVSISREVWLVRNKNSRELRYVLRKDFAGKVDIPPGVSTAPSNPKGQWEVLRILVTNRELLTLTPNEAKEYGFVGHLIKAPRNNELSGVMKHFNVTAEPTILRDNWSERLVGFLSSTPVMGFLFFAAILCAYIEMNTPGFGVAGTIAVVCFAIIFGSRFLVGMAAWWEIALFAIGLLLVAIEVFITPGFGIMGIAGVLCCVVAMLAIIVPNAPGKLPIPQTPLDWSIFANGLLALMIGFLMACAGGVVMARFLPKVPAAGRLILQPPVVEPTSPAAEAAAIHSVHVGDTGTVEGPCRPVGQVRFGEILADAIADGGFLSTGTTVKAVKIEGNRVVVTTEV